MRYSRGSPGIPGGSYQADPPTHAFRTFTRAALPSSQDIQMQLPMLLHVWRACLSDKNCVLVDSCGRARAHVCRCACVCAHARVCVRLLVCLCARVCTACVKRTVCACASRLHAPSHRTAATGGINSSARAALCGRERVVAFVATGRARARRPQVSPGRAARPTRDGLRDKGTRPWSMPPAPSTSSAAATAAPTSRTCG